MSAGIWSNVLRATVFCGQQRSKIAPRSCRVLVALSRMRPHADLVDESYFEPVTKAFETFGEWADACRIGEGAKHVRTTQMRPRADRKAPSRPQVERECTNISQDIRRGRPPGHLKFRSESFPLYFMFAA